MYLYSLAEKHHGGEMQYLTSSIFMCVYKERRNSRLIDLQVGHLFCRPAAEMPLSQSIAAAAAAIFNSAAWSQTWKNPRGDSLVGLILAAAWWNSTWQAASARKWKCKHDAAAAEWHKQRESERWLHPLLIRLSGNCQHTAPANSHSLGVYIIELHIIHAKVREI